MRIEIEKDILLKAVTTADSVISSKNVNTILSHCLFTASNDRLFISATDNEIGIRTEVEALTDGDFSFTVNGGVLAQILKELPKGAVVLSIDESYSISVKSKSPGFKGNLSLVGTEKGDFPDIPNFVTEGSVEMDQAVLKDMIRKVHFAASTDTVKPVFNGVYLALEEGNMLTAVASDSRRLSLMKSRIEKTAASVDGIIVPLKTINELYRLLSSGICRLNFRNNQCFFMIGSTEIVSRIIDGQFPNYKQVIPRDFIAHCIVDTKKFTESLKRVMIMTREPTYKITLRFTKGSLQLESRLPDVGESQESVEAEFNGDEILLGINSQYLMDAIKEMDSISARIAITGQLSPVTVQPEGGVDMVSVIMPIQIKNAD